MDSFQTCTGNLHLVPCPVVIVGAYKDDGQANFSISAWSGTVCSNPPMLSCSFREATLTHSLLQNRKEFTVSLASSDQIAQIDYVGTKTGRTEDKAAAVKWEVKKASKVNAPYSPSFGIVYQCKLVESKKLGLHTIFFGEIVEVNVRNDCVGEGTTPSLAKIDPVIMSGYDKTYFKLGAPVGAAFELYKKIEAK
jgi:flavin reductase (DIM6/NTAB) family NADH-FMN oxidoreductase RutF